MDREAPSLARFRRFALLPDWLLLSLISALLLLSHLSCPLLEPEEARYAEIPRQMLAEGQFIEPVLHGEPYYQKPPLLYWLIMLSYQLFGVHDWAARLIPALASFFTVFVTWLWGRRALGPRAGFAGAVMLVLSGRFIYLGRMLTIDPLLSLWVTSGLATAHLAVCESKFHWRWWITSALMTGLGLLTKGPVAAALTLVPVLLIPFLDRRFARPSLRALLGYLGLAICVAAPWYAAMAIKNPEAAADFLWLHHVQRYLDPLDHQEPIWFFLPSLLWGTLPWSLLLVPLARWMLRRDNDRPPALGFALLSFGWCLLFFSLSGCKRAVYILPAMPWLALCLGCCVSPEAWQGWRWQPSRGQGKICAAMVFAMLLIGVNEFLPRYHRQFSLRGQLRRHLGENDAVFCYPKRWDSVSFYLQRGDVRVFTAEQKEDLVASLQSQPGALLLVKSKTLPDLLSSLPAPDLVKVGRQTERLSVLAPVK